MILGTLFLGCMLLKDLESHGCHMDAREKQEAGLSGSLELN